MKKKKPGGRLSPEKLAADLQRAVALHGAGRFAEAEQLARKVLASQPANSDALNLLGGIAAQSQRWGEAEKFVAKAARITPNNPFMQFNLGCIKRNLNQSAAARAALEEALRLKPDFAPAAAELADLLSESGDRQAAIAVYRRAIALDPSLHVAHNNLGNLLRLTGDPQAALPILRAALEQKPGFAEAQANLALTLGDLGDIDGATTAFQQAVRLQPDSRHFWQGFAENLRDLKSAPACPGLRDDLLACLHRADVNHKQLASVSLLLLAETRAVQGLLDWSHQADPPADFLESPQAQEGLKDEFLHLLLSRVVVRDRRFESLLTKLRRQLLAAYCQQREQSDSWGMLLPAMAAQCFLNEYVWFVGPEEDVQVAELEQQLSAGVAGGGAIDPAGIALLACYRPLFETSLLQPLRNMEREGFSPALAGLLREQVDEPLAEHAARETFALLGPVEDAVSRAVRQQYEENPYPRWKTCHVGTPRPLLQMLTRKLPHVSAEELPDVAAPEVLIAGCGSGLQTMRVATSYAGANILAIDLSLASLAYSARKTAGYGLTNIDYLQADILQLGKLDRRFDVVESFGVLHHMAEPARGLSVLAGLLKPGGVMLLGIYSEIARSSVVAVRELIAQRGYPSTPAGIRQCRQEIFALADQPEYAAVTSPASDFWTLSDTRDLVFHVHEHRYNLLQLSSMLAESGLEFLGFELPDAATARAFALLHPGSRQIRSLARWHDYEVEHPATFGDTYRFWVKKSKH